LKEFGVVTEVNKDKVQIKVNRRTACGNCKACGMTDDQKEHLFELTNTIGASVGDTVVLEMKSRGFLGAVSILYGVPLIALISGVAVGSFISKIVNELWDPSILGAIGGAFFVAIAFYLVSKYEKVASKNRTYIPVITGFKEDNKLEEDV